MEKAIHSLRITMAGPLRNREVRDAWCSISIAEADSNGETVTEDYAKVTCWVCLRRRRLAGQPR